MSDNTTDKVPNLPFKERHQVLEWSNGRRTCAFVKPAEQYAVARYDDDMRLIDPNDPLPRPEQARVDLKQRFFVEIDIQQKLTGEDLYRLAKGIIKYLEDPTPGWTTRR